MLLKRTLVIGAIAVLGFTGLAAGCDTQSSTTNSSNTPGTSTNTGAEVNANDSMHASNSAGAADLRVGLTQLFGQHLDLAAAATRAGFDGRTNDFNAAAKSLDNNSVAISKAIGSVYGADAESRFLAIWRSHIGFFVDYTVAAKKGDKAGMDKAVSNLGGYIDAISDFLSKANPNLSREAVKATITEHVMQLKGAVDAYGAGDIAKSYSEQEMAYMHMGDIAKTISGAIVKQYPDKF